jgi:maltooligosyltrehalose trehalohydrolase
LRRPGRSEAYYTDYRGTAQELVSALNGATSIRASTIRWQKQRRGTPAFGVSPATFITYIQNHDQVANSGSGLRLDRLTSPGRYRALTALLLLGPATPMLFQGQEFAASSPFLFFADHPAKLAQAVRKDGPSSYHSFAAWQPRKCSASFLIRQIAPHSKDASSILNEREAHCEVYALHCDLLRLRRTDPVFSQPRAGSFDGAILGSAAF